MQFEQKSKKRESNLESLLEFVAIEIENHLGIKELRQSEKLAQEVRDEQ